MSRRPAATLAELRARVQDFVHRRDWEQFHSPKNLSMSIAIEAAELMECFQWESGDRGPTPYHKPPGGAAADELADVLIYCLAMADALGIEDLGAAVLDKLARTEEKYPVAEFRGRYR
jgi:dCTP diphosphatase